jgi:hypothetical protein
MTSAISTSLSGLQSATRRLNVSAENIVIGNRSDLDPKESDAEQPTRITNSGGPVGANFNLTSDLVSSVVDLKLAEISYKASARALKVALEIDKNLIDQVS